MADESDVDRGRRIARHYPLHRILSESLAHEIAYAIEDRVTERLVQAALYFDGVDQSIEIALGGQQYVVTKLHEMAADATRCDGDGS